MVSLFLPCLNVRKYFPNTYYKNLIKHLELKFIQYWGTLMTRALGVCNSWSCPHRASSISSITVHIFLPWNRFPWFQFTSLCSRKSLLLLFAYLSNLGTEDCPLTLPLLQIQELLVIRMEWWLPNYVHVEPGLIALFWFRNTRSGPEEWRIISALVDVLFLR